MIANHLNLKAIVAATLITVTISMPLATSASEKPAESALLTALISADAKTARALDRELQALWRKSGSAAMDLLLKRAGKAVEAQDLGAKISMQKVRRDAQWLTSTTPLTQLYRKGAKRAYWA
jgi:hypothetical protein